MPDSKISALTAGGTALATDRIPAARDPFGATDNAYLTPNGLLDYLLGVSPPQGRITLTTAVPVLTATASGQTTVYYTPYFGQYVPLYDGTRFKMHNIGGELSQTTTDDTKSPAAVANSSNYDLFVWIDSGTYRCTRGPAWSSDTARGTGAGTTELERVAGILVNKIAITNGPAAQRGTYVGTIRSNGSAQIDFILGGTAVGGTAGFIGIWNMYNRRHWGCRVCDSTDSYSYTTTTWRQSNASAGMQVSFINGLNEDIVDAGFSAVALTSGNPATCGVGLDSTSAIATDSITGIISTSGRGTQTGRWAGLAGLGFHYVAALERGASGASYLGDNGTPGDVQSGFVVRGLY